MKRQFGSNLDEYGFERYEENAFPVAYLITFRTYGTWLHGDERSSMQRGRDRRFGTIRLAPNVPLEEKMADGMKNSAVLLTEQQRGLVDIAIRETCEHRGFGLRACNVRTNHVHVVVKASVKPEKIAGDFKSYSTRLLRKAGEFLPDQKIWTRGASTRYLWKPHYVDAAIEYVLYSQGDVPFETVIDLSDA
ncbi:MAG: transposase [Acidobacteria bacterium]|nr:transposase [Acidobacteriota bacterium]